MLSDQIIEYCLLGTILLFNLIVMIILFLNRDKLIKSDARLQTLHAQFNDLNTLTRDHQQAIKDHLNAQVSQQQVAQLQLQQAMTDQKMLQQRSMTEIKEVLVEYRGAFDQHIVKGLMQLQESNVTHMQEVRNQLTNTLTQHSQQLQQTIDKLTLHTHDQLQQISAQVEKRLTEGFEKTTATFTDVLKRLALIDEAQKRITELSSNVVSLQEVLADKRSRGAFGEIQLNALIRNVLPETTFALQYTLPNNKRADCILFLPEPTGNIVIDAKFPLENYRKMVDLDASAEERTRAQQTFRQDLRNHIQDISSKYIIPNCTADGAIMFIPAEAVFAEIHAHYPDIIEISHKARVWLASPTTMMAILTTARAALKDADTRKQVHVIQEHLSFLGKDFDRFQKRMDALARHIQQAHEDVKDVHTSSRKISNRFIKIEKVELDDLDDMSIDLIEADKVENELPTT